MDPLSMTASIIAILQLTTTLTGSINDMRHATREQKVVAIEASNLYGCLTSLRFRVEEAQSNDPWFKQVKLLGIKDGPLDQFKDVLEKMVEQISPTRKRDQVKSVLMWKFTKVEIENMLKRMERLKSLIQCALTEDVLTLSRAICGDVATLGNRVDEIYIRTEELRTHTDQELRHRLAQWLGVPDPSTNYHAALKKRHHKTGFWLVEGTGFNNWKGSESSLMWLYGNAGCGKTVLSAAALQTIFQHQESRSGTAVGYFYFDFNNVEKRSSRKAIRSLLFQFAQQVPSGLQSLEQMYQKCGHGQQQPLDDAIHSLLLDMMDHTQFKYIILDALDECTDRDDLLTFVCALADSRLQGLRMMATSRRERDIEEQLRPRAGHNVNIQSAIVDEDIRVYVQDRLVTDSRLKKWPKVVRDEITSVMMEKANGMFRWVYCQLESIRPCVKLRALREALSSLPKTLDETYERILLNLESAGQLRDAITALQWLCYSRRPLRLSEMVEVLAIENGENGGFFPEERLPDPTDIMLVCSSLISYNPTVHDGENDDKDSFDKDGDDGSANDSNQVQLAHFSVQEYLLSNRCAFRSKFAIEACRQQIAEGCLRYLLYLGERSPLTREVVGQHPLARYAAEQWWQLTQNLEVRNGCTVFDLALRLLTVNSTALLSWVQLYNSDQPWQGVDLSLTFYDIAQPLYYAASVGVFRVVEEILHQNVDVNAQGGQYGNALQTASLRGHEKVVQMLIDAGAEVNAQGGEYGNALQAASCRGHEKVVQMLLDTGAEVNAQGGLLGHALQAASLSGHEKVVQILINVGAEVNAQGGYFGNALQAASVLDHEKVVQILIDAGAEVNAQGGVYGHALQAASLSGNEKVVQILIDAGAKVNAQGGAYGNALQAASAHGHEKVVQMLIDAGAEVNAQGGDFGNALQAA